MGLRGKRPTAGLSHDTEHWVKEEAQITPALTLGKKINVYKPRFVSKTLAKSLIFVKISSESANLAFGI